MTQRRLADANEGDWHFLSECGLLSTECCLGEIILKNNLNHFRTIFTRISLKVNQLSKSFVKKFN